MSTHVHAAAKPADSSSFAPYRSGLLQRKCGCESQTLAGGHCGECRDNRESTANRLGTTEARSAQSSPGHDFGRVQIHSDTQPFHASSSQSISINGRSAPDGPGEFFVNGPDPKQSPPSAPAPKPQTPPAKAAAKCPTDIKINTVKTVDDKDIGKDGVKTGWGGYALMEVSDPSGQNWNGTEIQEKVKRVSNTCGARGNLGCSNKSGQGFSGSTFKVGGADNFNGLIPLPAKANMFFDTHTFTSKIFSLLYEKGIPSCEVQCQQSYYCDGKQIGPNFTITYSMTKDLIAKYYEVTRVELSKSAVAAKTAAPPAAPPAAPTGGAKP